MYKYPSQGDRAIVFSRFSLNFPFWLFFLAFLIFFLPEGQNFWPLLATASKDQEIWEGSKIERVSVGFAAATRQA